MLPIVVIWHTNVPRGRGRRHCTRSQAKINWINLIYVYLVYEYLNNCFLFVYNIYTVMDTILTRANELFRFLRSDNKIYIDYY